MLRKQGYNLKNSTDGGDGVCNPTEYTRRKISENHSNCKGDKNPFYNKKHSLESLEKMRKPRCKEFGKKMSLIMKDKISKNEFISAFKKGRDNPSAKSVTCKDKNGIVIKKYETILETANDGFSPDCVSKCIRGLNKTHKGYIFSLF